MSVSTSRSASLATRFAAAIAVVSFAATALAADPLGREIDRRIEAALSNDGLEPAPRATDVELHRRLHLDLLGRIPTTEETDRFLADESPDRVETLIDRLLEHEEFPVAWARVVDVWLNERSAEPPFGRDQFLAYLERAIEENRGWDRIARELILPNLDDETEQGASYFLASRIQKGDADEKLDAMTTAVASGLFGVQLQCAKCHDHPLVAQWCQDHYYGLASFLVRTQPRKYRDRVAIGERAEGEVTFLTTEQEERPATLMFLDGHVVEEPEAATDERDRYVVPKGAKDGRPEIPKFSRREALAEYALRRGNPFFERAIVNRVWKRLMGRGLVEPVDQMHEANPATHPVLLAFLADDLATHDFDLRRLIRALVRSETYRRSTRWTRDAERPADSTYAIGLLKPLDPEQLALSLNVATGNAEVLRRKWEREKEKRKLDAITAIVVRRLLEQEREFREIVGEFDHRGTEFRTNASQALFLAYNPAIERQFRPAEGSLVRALAEIDDTTEAVERAWLAVLSRPPTPRESKIATVHLGDEPSEQAFRELVWSLVTGAEFRFNH